ncbi:cobyrinic acid a,c-diamide synthase [Rhodoblastus sphagnicola]|uniref:Hydrogenobyrinate a,c-diamide synthase n=1 Tax=Rhodoblastus sphagnicola TaxID=333368 RepID=A0A2S6N8Y8_9HYPH|nr:cobyrinate a,c-diamide synthase [Rhodoblastus sphagnicola]MBB4196864.1 cobyrinic acid a,c-diamide synthase [Rhodoblastus sphagnicola]PPQ31086.1 cobyrinic acid a,c-diamide synthase [Rhodoblastus sphagnicola]
MNARGLLIAAPRSGGGKTTVALGLMRALRDQGLRVGAVKSGPDYIDSAFHTAATGRPSLNLDTWAMDKPLIAGLAGKAAEDADLLIAEASMGLFDGAPGASESNGSSAALARQLKLPVALVLDVSGHAQTAAAIAKGFVAYDASVKIAGVILNKVGSARHILLTKTAIEELGLPVFGALPCDPNVTLPERHLGLVQAADTSDLEAKLKTLAAFVAAHVDLDAIQAAAQPLAATPTRTNALKPPGQKIALARDAAFSFIYPHLLLGWRRAGAEIAFFSPLQDEAPPEDADACWLPGGYPELHAGRLSNARNFIDGLRHFAATKPVHGECGGYMVLGQTLVDAEGVRHPMTGLLSVSTSFAKRKMTLGYRRATLSEGCALGTRGQILLGHEFHYATVESQGGDPAFALAGDAYGSEAKPVGSRQNLVTGSFFHVIAAEPG